MRTRLRLAALTAATALLAGCASATTLDGGAAAVVGGVSVPRAQLEQAVFELVGDVQDLTPEGRAGAVGPTQRRILQMQIQGAVVESVALSHGIDIGTADTDRVGADILAAVGGQEQLELILLQNGLTQALFDELIVPQEARIQAIQDEVGPEELPVVLLDALDTVDIAIAPGLGEWDPVTRSVVETALAGTGGGELGAG